jgi:FkbM family methyltransferase
MSELIIYQEMFIDGAYDLSCVEFLPDTVVDCGAYEGYFTLLAQAWFPNAHYLAFEPQTANYAAFLQNLRLNEVDVDVRHEAVSVLSKEMNICGTGCGAHLEVGFESAGTRIKVANLCEVIKDLAPQRLLIKMDVEGEEEKILPALLPVLPTKCAIFFEWHHGEERFRQAQKLMEVAGFTVERCRTWWPHGDGVAFVDAFAQRQ